MLGGILLLVTLRIVRWGELWRLWPVVLVPVGLQILPGGRPGWRRRATSCPCARGETAG